MTYIPTPDEDGVRRYGYSVKHREDVTRCAVSVSGRERWPSAHQCHRKRGYGPDKLYCKQHDPAVEQARRAQADKRWDDKRKAESRPRRRLELAIKALEQIASGEFSDIIDAPTRAKNTLAEIRRFDF
jgi:hypothetical protein